MLHFFYVCGATRENLSHCLCYNPLNKQYIKIDGRLHIYHQGHLKKSGKLLKSVLWFSSTGCVFLKSLKKRSSVESMRYQLLRRLYMKVGYQRSRTVLPRLVFVLMRDSIHDLPPCKLVATIPKYSLSFIKKSFSPSHSSIKLPRCTRISLTEVLASMDTFGYSALEKRNRQILGTPIFRSYPSLVP